MKNHRYFTEQLGCKSRWSALIKIMEVNDILYLIISCTICEIKKWSSVFRVLVVLRRMLKAELSQTRILVRRYWCKQTFPTENKRPSTSLRNVYYFYTETLCKIINQSYTGKIHIYSRERNQLQQSYAVSSIDHSQVQELQNQKKLLWPRSKEQKQICLRYILQERSRTQYPGRQEACFQTMRSLLW